MELDHPGKFLLTSHSIIADRDEQTSLLECRGARDLTIGETEHLMDLLIAAGDEIHNRGEDPELVEMVDHLMCRLLGSDTSEIADEARQTIPRLHELWCGAAQHFDLTADDSDDGDGFRCTGPRHASAVRDSRHAVQVFCLFAGWVVLREVDLLCRAPFWGTFGAGSA